jgi:hypothetical protein
MLKCAVTKLTRSSLLLIIDLKRRQAAFAFFKGYTGQVVEEISLSKINPERRYLEHRCFSEDEGGENYYN